MSLFLRSLFWAVLCPGTVAFFLPWFILSGPDLVNLSWSWRQWLGLALAAAGAAILIWCIYAFARHGRGTLSPLDPARHLVMQGLYRYVRNPMYGGVTVVLLGEALFFGSVTLLGYAAVVFAAFNLFIRLYEEPCLHRQFGGEYEQYCRRAGRWLPRRRY